MKTSKDIIVRLIDENKISGEEAYQLINDILQSEMLETYKALENKKNRDIFISNQGTTSMPNTNTWYTGTLTATDNDLISINGN